MSQEEKLEEYAINMEAANEFYHIGMKLEDEGEYESAIVEYRKSLKIRESMLGMNHPDTCNAYKRIGDSLRNLGNADEALQEYRKVVSVHESLHAGGLVLADSYVSVGVALYEKGSYNEALVELRKAIGIYEALITAVAETQPQGQNLMFARTAP